MRNKNYVLHGGSMSDDFKGPVNTGKPGDPTQRQPDMSLVKEKFGWEPTIYLVQGFKKIRLHFERLLRIIRTYDIVTNRIIFKRNAIN